MNGGVVIGSIVEGHGEVPALPELVRRIGREKFGREPECLVPHRIPRPLIPQPEQLDRALRLQAGRVGNGGGVLVVLDADDDDPEALRRDVQAIADAAVPGGVVVVVAVKEFEAWFLAAIESLRSHRSVKNDATYVGDPEGKRNAKKELELQMTESYTEVRHQVAFCARLDLVVAAGRSASFASLVDAVARLLRVSDGA